MHPLPIPPLSALALGLALPLAAGAQPTAAPGAAPAVEISCTINAVTRRGTETVSRPKITTLQGRPATISVRRGEGDGEPAHSLELELSGGPEGVAGEARVTIGDQPPVSHAIHISHGGQWKELNVIGTFKYLVDCSAREVPRVEPPAAPAEPAPPGR